MSALAAPSEPVTLSLLPDDREEGTYTRLTLDFLPDSATLLGDDPSRSMIESVRRLGVLSPLLALPGPNETVRIVDGRRRLKAARAAGLDEVPVLLYPEGWTAAQVLSLVANTQRSENVLADLRSIEQLLEAGHPEEEIVEATGMPIQTIRKRLRLHGLIQPLRAAMDTGALSAGVAVAAAKCAPAQQTRLLATLEAEGKLTFGDVHDARTVERGASLDLIPASAFSEPVPRGPGAGEEWKAGAGAAFAAFCGTLPVAVRTELFPALETIRAALVIGR